MSKRYLIGIDPGSVNLGWAIIQRTENSIKYIDSGTYVITNKMLSFREKLISISNFIEDLLRHEMFYDDEGESLIDFVFYENLYVFKNLHSAIDVSQIIGAINYVVSKSGTKTTDINPLEMKKILTGMGSADKFHIQESLTHIFNKRIEFETDHESDAVGIAVAGYYKFFLEDDKNG